MYEYVFDSQVVRDKIVRAVELSEEDGDEHGFIIYDNHKIHTSGLEGGVGQSLDITKNGTVHNPLGSFHTHFNSPIPSIIDIGTDAVSKEQGSRYPKLDFSAIAVAGGVNVSINFLGLRDTIEVHVYEHDFEAIEPFARKYVKLRDIMIKYRGRSLTETSRLIDNHKDKMMFENLKNHLRDKITSEDIFRDVYVIEIER